MFVEVCHDSKKVVDHFNKFFTGVAEKLVSKLPQAKNIYHYSSDILKKFYSVVFLKTAKA